MSDSLKDQLLALGLAKPRKAKKKKAGSVKKPPGADGGMSLERAWRERQRAEKRAAEAERQARQAEQLARARTNRAIQALVDEHALNDPDAELRRNFLYKGRIRSVRVTRDQLRAVNAGELAVVFLRGAYYLVTPEVAEKARAISEEHVPDLTAGSDGCEDDDVPEDLVW